MTSTPVIVVTGSTSAGRLVEHDAKHRSQSPITVVNEAHIPAGADHDVIEDADSHDLADLLETTGNIEIRRWIKASKVRLIPVVAASACRRQAYCDLKGVVNGIAGVP